MDERTPDRPTAQSEPCDYEVPKDPIERRARIEEGMRESRQRMLDAIREHDETLRELEKKKGILERLFGYRTSV